MCTAASIPATVLEMVIGFLLPLLLPAAAGDVPAARAAALSMLAEHQPRTARELRLAGEVIVNSLRGLQLLARTAEPGLPVQEVNEALKWACSLGRAGHQAQRRLDDLRRPKRSVLADADAPPDAALPDTVLPDTVLPDAALPDAALPGAALPDEAAAAPPPVIAVVAPPQASAQPAAPAAGEGQADIARAEAEFDAATQLLGQMKAHYKGAPPPHSKAAQQIQVQQRMVDMSRIRLQQARKRLHDAASMAGPARVAA